MQHLTCLLLTLPLPGPSEVQVSPLATWVGPRRPHKREPKLSFVQSCGQSHKRLTWCWLQPQAGAGRSHAQAGLCAANTIPLATVL